MLFKVVTKHDGTTRIHFRSQNAEDCFAFIRNQRYPLSTLKYVVTDGIDRVIKNKKEKHEKNFNRYGSIAVNGRFN